MKYYDTANNRLVFLNQKADSAFWDKLWDIDDFKKSVSSGKNDRFVSVITKKFITPDKNHRILEGGCGKGNFVFSLDYNGYDAFGVDYATKTIEKINEAFPLLNVSCQDVRKLNFVDNFFDGYWSLGVIEHFFDGYEDIISEAHRVLKDGGYLFLTFPYLSPFRKIKIKLNLYNIFDRGNFKEEKFYQFALDYENVRQNLEKNGFQLVYKKPLDGFKGLKDETSAIKNVLQKIYSSQNIIFKILSAIISNVLTPISGHSILLVFKKNK